MLCLFSESDQLELPQHYFQEPELSRIAEPNIQPQANVAQIKAQLDTLNVQENDALIKMMGGTQDFPNA